MENIDQGRYKNGDNILKEYKKEIKIFFFLILLGLVFYFGNKVYQKARIFFDITYQISEKWGINFPEDMKVVKKVSETGWFGEGFKLLKIAVSDRNVKNSILDFKKFNYKLTEDDMELLDRDLSTISDKELRNEVPLKSQYIKKMTYKAKTDTIFIFFNVKNSYYYLLEDISWIIFIIEGNYD